MDMILHTSGNDGLALKIMQYSTEVTVQFVAQVFLAKEWLPVFR